MKTVEKQKVEKEVVVDITCNKCGESCKDYADAGHKYFNHNYAHITPEFGYGSVLYDMDEWEVHICEPCYAAFEATFLIKPQKNLNTWG